MTPSKRAEALAEYYIDQLSSWASVSRRPLFGACGLYRDGIIFAMVWHGSLYFKVDDESRATYEAANSQTLGYQSKGEDHALKSYWTVPADVTEDSETLCAWAERAYQAALKNGKQ